MRHVPVVLLIGLMAFPLTAQTPAAGDARFEVVSVRSVPAGVRGSEYQLTPTRFLTTRTLVELAQLAYRLRFYEVVDGPDWVRTERFTVNAAIPETAAAGDLPAMVRHLLGERFALTVRREQRPMSVLALVRAQSDGRLGPQMTPVSRPCAQNGQPGESCSSSEGLGEYRTSGLPWDIIVRTFEGFARRPILDETGLSGQWDLELEWNPDLSRIPDGFDGISLADLEARPVLFTALEEQLGLKLESRTAPVEVLVIDSAERPEPN